MHINQKAHSFHVFVKRSELDGIKNDQSKAVAIMKNHYSASLWPFGHTLPYTKKLVRDRYRCTEAETLRLYQNRREHCLIVIWDIVLS